MPNWLEKLLAAAGLILASPALGLAALAVLIETGRPVLFRQARVGRGGRIFELLKLRSMYTSHPGALLTRAGESRITRVGRFLRQTKLDELPQLVNVLRGEMALVGPRPEVPQFVDPADPLWQKVLLVRPGVTDPASLRFCREEELLARVADVERHYVQVILPQKLTIAAEYLERRTWLSDFGVLARTAGAALLPRYFSGRPS